MKNISNALQQFLLSNTVFSRAYLITITLPNGQVLNVLDGTNTDITIGPNLNAGALIGGWADVHGELVDVPFQVGDSWSAIAPIGATQLLLGVEDIRIFSDNTGSWTMHLLPAGTNIVVAGTAQPWTFSSSGKPTNKLYYFDISGGAGTAPTSVAVTTGTVYSLSYVSGLVSRNISFFGAYDANGAPTSPVIDAPNPVGGYGWPGYWIPKSYIAKTTFYCSRYGVWERGAFTNEATFSLKAGSMELTAYIPESVVYPGTTTPLMQVINQGVFNGATVSIQTLYWGSTTPAAAFSSMGTMQLTKGQIGSVKPAGRSKVIFEVFDMIYLLNRPTPPHSIQSACRHSLFDAGCTLLVSSFTSTNIPLAVNSTTLYLNLNIPARANGTAYVLGNVINVGGIPYFCSQAGTSAGSPPTFNTTRGAITVDGGVHWTSMDQAYILGYVQFTAGQNSGLKASIKAQVVTGGVIQMQLLKPLAFAVTTGDTLQLVPGCDKTMATCTNIYNNLIHFGGQPFVPNPEVAQ